MTAKMLLEQYMAERQALGFVSKTDEGCIQAFPDGDLPRNRREDWKN